MEEALEETYGPNYVTQMTSGKAIARALCGLFLIDAALSTNLVTTLLPTGEVTTMTDIHESVSNEGNDQDETLSLSLSLSLRVLTNQWTPITDKRY